MVSFTSDISEDVYDIESSTGLKLSLKRRRRLSNSADTPSIQPAEKRQCLTLVSSSDLSVSFQPVFASTWNERELSLQITVEPPEQVEAPVQVEPSDQVEASDQVDDPLSLVEGHSTHVLPVEVTHPNIVQPEWPQQPSSLHATTLPDSCNLIDIEPACNLTSLGNPEEPYFKLLRKGSNRGKDVIF